MRGTAVLLVALTALLAGCANVKVEGLQRSDAPREPYYAEHRDMVAPQHNKTYEVPVLDGATLVNATLHLTPRNTGIPVAAPTLPPGAAPAPAKLTLEVLDAAGRAGAAAVADPSTPNVTLPVHEITVPGAWTLRVTGGGASGSVDGQDYGAAYLLTVEVLY